MSKARLQAPTPEPFGKISKKNMFPQNKTCFSSEKTFFLKRRKLGALTPEQKILELEKHVFPEKNMFFKKKKEPLLQSRSLAQTLEPQSQGLEPVSGSGACLTRLAPAPQPCKNLLQSSSHWLLRIKKKAQIFT